MRAMKLKYALFKLADCCGLAPKRVVVLIDGGVCSQMNQYLLGYLYMRRGFRVEFDMTFFEKWGTDMNFQFVRNFDLTKAFPALQVHAVEPHVLRRYRKCYSYMGNLYPVYSDDMSFLDRPAPLYLCGYYHLPPALRLNTFRTLYRVDPEVLDAENVAVYHEIVQRKDSVAVHVRRGDLKVEIEAYGKPASDNYFQRAVDLMRERLETPYFYFFSDEPDWVRDTLIPQLGLGDACRVVDINGSDRGYMDLMLIAACRHQITSKGTLGKFGAVMGDNPEKIVTLCDDPTQYEWRELLHNAVFIA